MAQAKEKYRILGIDPGTNYTGYGVVEVDGRNVSAVVMGEIDLHKITDPYEKLRYIFDSVSRLVREYQPREVALESPFFGQNVQSMLKLGRAQGVAMAAAISRDIPITEYAPLKIKMAITGNGQASKEQVADMLKRILKMNDDMTGPFLDATDALAAAYCHYLQMGRPEVAKGCGSWTEFVANNPNRVNKGYFLYKT